MEKSLKKKTPSQSNSMTLMSFYIDPDARARIEKISKKKRVSMGEIIRRAIMDYNPE